MLSFLRLPALFIFLSLNTALSEVSSQGNPALTPKICSGIYQLATESSTTPKRGLVRSGSCPANHALFSVRTPTVSRYTAASDIPVSGFCCPLPSNDILTNVTTTHTVSCPKNSIATGISSKGCDSCSNALLCTEVNTQRYIVSDSSPGVVWGVSSNPWKSGASLQEADIPPALRYGVNRIDNYADILNGCVAFPFGGVLAGKANKRCSGFTFRHLYFSGIGNDPKGVAVPMFPTCTVVVDIYSATPRCIE